MDFMKILKEAKEEKTTTIDVSEDASKGATNYNDEADAMDDTADDADTTTEEDTGDTAEEEPADTEEQTDDEATDDNVDEESDEGSEEEDGPTDYTAETEDIGTEDDTSSDDTAGGDDNQSSYDDGGSGDSDDPYAEKNRALMDDFIALYSHININIDKFDKVKSLDMMTSAIVGQVKNNLTELSEYLYTYIRGPFKKKTYADNLYTYKYVIQLYKLCVQMLSKIDDFGDNT